MLLYKYINHFRKVFGWDFDTLAVAVQQHFQECIKPIEGSADAALQSENPEEAIQQYSTALTLDPLNPAGLLVKRSKARAMSGSWEDALNDADGVGVFFLPYLTALNFADPGYQSGPFEPVGI